MYQDKGKGKQKDDVLDADPREAFVPGGGDVATGFDSLLHPTYRHRSIARESLKPSTNVPSAATSISSASRESLQPVKAATARLGALGIPLSDDDDDFADDDAEGDDDAASRSHPSTRSEMESVQVNPASPTLPPGPYPRLNATSVHQLGSTTPRGPPPLSGSIKDQERLTVTRAGSALSEESFRDIVDDLTIENRKLKGRLRRFEASSVPASLERDRLFEVRFFDGFPPSRRQEIESFLTRYVQHLQSEDESASGAAAGSGTERARIPGLRPPPISRRSHEAATIATDTTSSIGVTIRSLRSSEKDELTDRAAGQAWHKARRGSGTGSGSGSGSGSGVQKTNSSGDAAHQDQEPPHILPPFDAKVALPQPATPVGLADDMQIDPPPTDATPEGSPKPESSNILQGEQDMLAAPSFSGIEPQSASGTGTGMRMTDPHHRHSRRKSRTTAPTPEVPHPTISRRESKDLSAPVVKARDEEEESPPPHHQNTAGSGDSSSESEMTTSLTTAEPLAKIVVELVERLFEEALLRSPSADSPPNTLASEPSPLPATASSNTRYLRTMLDSDETKRGGGWVYLNLLLTMAGVHRLNLSINFLRWALKRRSQRIEVSEDGSKVRWRGEARKRNDIESAAARAEGVDANDATMDNDTREAVEQRRRANDLAATTPVPPPHPHLAKAKADRPDEHQTTLVAEGSAGSDPLRRIRSEAEDDGQSNSVPTLSSTKNSSNKNTSSTGATSVPTLDSGSNGSKNYGSSARDESGRSTRSGVSRASVSGTATNSMSNSQPSDTLRRVLKKELLDARGVPEYSLRDEMVFAAPLGEAGDAEGSTTNAISTSSQHRPSPAAYVPMFGKRLFRDSDDEDNYLDWLNEEHSDERGDHDSDVPIQDLATADTEAASTIATRNRPARKRARRGASDGGLVFFRSDVFCSDLAGNAHVRARMDRASSAETDAVDRVRVSRSDGEDEEGLSQGGSLLFLSAPSSPVEDSLDPLAEAAASAISPSLPSEAPHTPDLNWPSPRESSDRDSPAFDIEPLAASIPFLTLSGMTNAVPSDHFTIWTKCLYPSFEATHLPARLNKLAISPVIASLLPSSPDLPSSTRHSVKAVHSHIVTHAPSTQVRFPRLRMRREGSDSDEASSDEEVFFRRSLIEPPADYLLSLGLPFHGWAPETRRDGDSDPRGSDSSDPDNEPIILD